MSASVETRRRRGLEAFRAGLAAETAAERAYHRRGAAVLARRWRRREGEIDLVVADGGVLVFVEVKTGRHAAEAITPRQWARLEAAACRYMMENKTGDVPARFDVVLVGCDGVTTVIENARTVERW